MQQNTFTFLLCQYVAMRATWRINEAIHCRSNAILIELEIILFGRMEAYKMSGLSVDAGLVLFTVRTLNQLG